MEKTNSEVWAEQKNKQIFEDILDNIRENMPAGYLSRLVNTLDIDEEVTREIAHDLIKTYHTSDFSSLRAPYYVLSPHCLCAMIATRIIYSSGAVLEPVLFSRHDKVCGDIGVSDLEIPDMIEKLLMLAFYPEFGWKQDMKKEQWTVGDDIVKYSEFQSIIDEAKGHIYGDRHASYGSAYDDFARTCEMYHLSFLSSRPFTELHEDNDYVNRVSCMSRQDGLRFMICVKISREYNKHKRDNLVDLIGYAFLLRDVSLEVREKLMS